MEKIINANWLFRYTDTGGDFSPIGLPHTFQLPYYGESAFYVGAGEYLKTLTFTADDLTKTVLLAFEGVFQHAVITVNEAVAGEHFGGYTPFDVDIAPFIKEGSNEVRIAVDNYWRPDLPPRAGEHVFCGGIYRDVALVVLPKSHVERRSVFVQTKSLDLAEKRAELCVSYKIINPTGAKIIAKVEFDGKILCSETASDKDNLFSFRLTDVRLWSPETPALYTLTLDYSENSETVTFGVRSMRFDKDEGFFLNGTHYLIEGINVHQDHGGWGDAVTRQGITRDLLLVKQAGFNMVRGSHYPKHTHFAKECDRLGLLFWCEAPFWGIGGFGAEGYWDAPAMPEDPSVAQQFTERLLKTTEEMVLAVRNSPSVCAYSMGNEVFFTTKASLPGAKQAVSEMLKVAKNLDPDRAAGLGGTQRGNLHTIGEVTGLNGDGATLYRHPPVPSMVSEYGSIVASRPGEYRLNYTDGTENNPKWRAGRALWCAFHHGSIADFGKLGIIDLYRMPLNAYYCYREKLTGTPPPKRPTDNPPTALLLTSDQAVITTDGTVDCMLVAAYLDKDGCPTRCDNNITLTVTKGEANFPTGAQWTMTTANESLADGCGAIELRSYTPGEIEITATAEGVASATVKVIAEGLDGGAARYPVPPKTSGRKADKTDILFLRPVLQVSSETRKNPREAISDNDNATSWKPTLIDNKAFLVIDTEGLRNLNCIELDSGAGRYRIKILLSADGKRWRKAYGNLRQKQFCAQPLFLKTKAPARFIRVEFYGKQIEVRHLRAYEK